MTARFDGRVALVTGGGSGIGRGIALALAREGAVVVVGGRRAAPLAETVALIEAEGGRARAATGDVTRSADVARMVDVAAGGQGALDVAVNNAGVLEAGPVAEMDEEAWARVLGVNVTGVWLSMKHEIAAMRGRGGVIVNVASTIGAHIRIPGLGAYAATKAAVSALTRAAARESIGQGIRINAISPGSSDTPMSLRPGETEQDRAARLRTALPIGRVATIDEIVAATLWLASPESSFVVGHDMVVDGGAAA